MDAQDQVYKGCLGLAVVALGLVVAICVSIGVGLFFGAGFGFIAFAAFSLVFAFLTLRAIKKAVK